MSVECPTKFYAYVNSNCDVDIVTVPDAETNQYGICLDLDLTIAYVCAHENHFGGRVKLVPLERHCITVMPDKDGPFSCDGGYVTSIFTRSSTRIYRGNVTLPSRFDLKFERIDV